MAMPRAGVERQEGMASDDKIVPLPILNAGAMAEGSSFNSSIWHDMEASPFIDPVTGKQVIKSIRCILFSP
jgi:hypothetical protein